LRLGPVLNVVSTLRCIIFSGRMSELGHSRRRPEQPSLLWRPEV